MGSPRYGLRVSVIVVVLGGIRLTLIDIAFKVKTASRTYLILDQLSRLSGGEVFPNGRNALHHDLQWRRLCTITINRGLT